MQSSFSSLIGSNPSFSYYFYSILINSIQKDENIKKKNEKMNDKKEIVRFKNHLILKKHSHKFSIRILDKFKPFKLTLLDKTLIFFNFNHFFQFSKFEYHREKSWKLENHYDFNVGQRLKISLAEKSIHFGELPKWHDIFRLFGRVFTKKRLPISCWSYYISPKTTRKSQSYISIKLIFCGKISDFHSNIWRI